MSEKDNICLATDEAEKCVEEPKIKSITFPRSGTDVGGLSSKEVATITLSALKEHINEGATLYYVILWPLQKN